MLKVFFVVLILIMIIIIVYKKQIEQISIPNETELENNLIQLTENKNTKQKFIKNVYGALHINHYYINSKKVIFPIKSYLSFINKSYKTIVLVDKKICQSRLTFKTYKNVNIAQNIANLCIFSLLFKNKCDILQNLNNYRLKYKLSKKEVLFTKYYLLESVLNWQILYYKELLQMQKLVLRGKQYIKSKVRTKMQRCEPFIYGVAKFNKNSAKIFIVNNINVSGCVSEFLKELKEYDYKINRLTHIFDIVCKDLKLC